MRVKMRTTYAGPAGTAGEGQIIDLDKDDAYALIEGGYAAQVDDDGSAPTIKARRRANAVRKPGKLETATAAPGETASIRKPGPAAVSG